MAKAKKKTKTKSQQQVRFLLSDASPLTTPEKRKLRKELREGSVKMTRKANTRRSGRSR